MSPCRPESTSDHLQRGVFRFAIDRIFNVDSRVDVGAQLRVHRKQHKRQEKVGERSLQQTRDSESERYQMTGCRQR